MPKPIRVTTGWIGAYTVVGRKSKLKVVKERPLAKNGVVLRDFKVGNHVFKKGTRDSWSQVRLSGGTESMLNVIGVHLKHQFNSEEEEKRLEMERQKEADRQLENLAVQLEREREEETRKRLAKLAAKRAAQNENLSR